MSRELLATVKVLTLAALASVLVAQAPAPAPQANVTPLPSGATPAQIFDHCVRSFAPTPDTMRTWSDFVAALFFDQLAGSCLRSAGFAVPQNDPRVPLLGRCLRTAVSVPEPRSTPLDCVAQIGFVAPSPPASIAPTASPQSTIALPLPTTAPSSRASSRPPPVVPSRSAISLLTPVPNAVATPRPTVTVKPIATPSRQAPIHTLVSPTIALSPQPVSTHGETSTPTMPASTAYLGIGAAFAAGTLFGVSLALRSLAQRARNRRRRAPKVEVDLTQRD